MICPRCGVSISASARFCSSCGFKLQELAPDQATSFGPAAPDVLEEHLRHQRYASVIAATSGSTAPRLVELRAEAQQLFEKSIQQLVTIYRQHHGSRPLADKDAEALLPYYNDEIDGIDEPFEADAYATALLGQAEQELAAHADDDRVRSLIYAARVLPVSEPERYTGAGDRLLTRIDSAPGDDASQMDDHAGNGSASAERPTILLSAEMVAPPAASSVPTTKLLGDEDDLHGPAATLLLSDEPDLALEALTRLESLLAELGDQATIQDQLRHAQELIDADSPYSNRLRRAEAQQPALEQVQLLETLLARPLSEWLSETLDLEAETGRIIALIEAAFDSDSPIAQELRARRDHTLQQRTLLSEKLKSLEELGGQALVEQLEDLERELPSDLPVLAQAQQRRTAYQTQQGQAREAEAAQKTRAALREQYRRLRIDLDNFILAPLPDPSQLLELRDQAQGASENPVLREDHPLDSATFAYYDLLITSRIYDVTRPSEKAQEGQTAVNSGDLLVGYRLFQEDLADALRGDNPEHRLVAERNVREALTKLVASLEADVRAALADAEDRLARFDYASVQASLLAQRQHVRDAEVEIAPDLELQLAALLDEAARMAERTKQVEMLRERAASYVEPEDSSPEYRRAIETLETACGLAPWLDDDLAPQIADLRLHEERYVSGLINRARVASRGRAYAEAERLLETAERNVGTPEQQQAVDSLRSAIFAQKENEQNRAEMIQAAHALAQAAEKGKDLDLLAAQIGGERERIGSRENPKVDDQSWTSINTLVSLAEERLAVWKRYQKVLSQAEQAMFLGNQALLDETLRQMRMMSEHRFLPIEEDLRQIKKTASLGSRAERARRLLSEIREALETSDRVVSPERISQVLLLTDAFDDDDIVADRQLLESIYPLLFERTRLAGYAEQRLFGELKAAYDQLTPELQRDPIISRLAQEAELALARKSFEEELQALLRRTRSRFEQGWFDPASFQEAVDELSAFARSAAPLQRQESPQLASAALDQLEQVARQLSSARVDLQNYRVQDARRRVKLVLQTLPTSEVAASTLLYSYYADLRYLRDQLQDVERDLAVQEQGGTTTQRAFDEIVQGYTTAVSEPRTAFNKVELQRTLAKFSAVTSPQHQVILASYTQTISAITRLLQHISDIESLMIDGPNPSSEPGQSASVGGRGRKRLVEAALNDALHQSQEIVSTPQGMVWLGIADDPKYQALRQYLPLADVLEAADSWLAQTSMLDMSLSKLSHLRRQFEPLQALDLKPKDQDTLKNADLGRLIVACEERWPRLARRKNDLVRRIEAKTALRKRLGWLFTSGTFVALIGIGGWSFQPTHDATISLLVGTLTPTPSPTLAPTPTSTTSPSGPTVVVVTATPLPTSTPIPTPTPIPPQSGVVIVPGSANVRARPDVQLEPIGVVVAGDEIELTGFTDAPSGVRWYRLDVPDRQLRDVWLLARIEVKDKVYDSLRFEGREALRPELYVPFAP